MPESAPGSVTIIALFALAARAASVLIGGLLRQIWAQHEKRTIEKTWQGREQPGRDLRVAPGGPVAWRHDLLAELALLIRSPASFCSGRAPLAPSLSSCG